MIDFHSHILHSIDDGAKSLDESLELVGDFMNQGVFNVVCTPHFYPDSISLEEFLAKRNASFRSLRDRCAEFTDFHLYSGAEVYCNEFLGICQDLTPLCIQGTGLIMVEMPFAMKWSSQVWSILEKVIDRHSLTIIIAHAERYPAVLRHPFTMLEKLTDMGCIIQVNTDSFIEKDTSSTVLKWLDKGLIHILGTDSHGHENRPPRMDKACSIITSAFGETAVEKLQSNARKLLSGKQLHGNNVFL